MKSTGFITVMLFLLGTVCLAEQRSWAYPYMSGGDTEWANSVVYANGYVYAAGAIGSTGAHDILVLCLTTGGQRVWEYIYTKPVGAEDEAFAIVRGDDGNLYVAGTSFGWGPNTGPDFFVLSLTAGGAYRWDYRKSQAADWNRYEVANSLVYASDGVYATGYLDYGGGTINTDVWTVKLDLANGFPIWERRWFAPGNTGGDVGNGIVHDGGNAVYVAGISTGQTTARDFTVLRLRADNGSVDWPYIYPVAGASEEVATSIAYGLDYNIYACGKSGLDFFALSLNQDGQLRWDDQYSCPGLDEALAITCGPDGNIYAAGNTSVGNQQAFAVVSYYPIRQEPPNPQRRWVYERYGDANDYAASIKCGYDGNVYAAGLTNSGVQGYFTVVSLPFDYTGSPNWVHQYDPTPSVADYHEARAIDCGLDGFIYSAGRVQTGGDDEFAEFDVVVVSINPLDGLCPGSTEPSSGRHLSRELGTNKVHIVYHTTHQGVNRVCHNFSSDGGTTWGGPLVIDEGLYPSVGVISMAMPINMPPAVVYVHGNELRYRYLDVWTQTWVGFSFQPPLALLVGAPSVYVTGTTVHVAYPVIDFMGLCYIYYNAFEYWAQDPGTYELVDQSLDLLGKPSLVCDGMWYPHVIYEKESRLWYAYRHPTNGWQHDRQIPSYPGVASYEPFIEYWGDYVHAPWAEAWDWPVTNSDVYRSQRNINTNGLWWDPVPVSVPDGNLSVSPVNASGDVFLYAEYNEATTQTLDPEYYSMVTTRRAFVEETPVHSDWPHNQLYVDPAGGLDQLYALWTDGALPNYYVKFKATPMVFDWGSEPRVFYPVTCGQAQASPYCKARTGYTRVNSYGIDYGDSLVYDLLFLDPCYDFVVKVAGTHGGSTTWEQQLTVDGQALASFVVRPVTLETLKLKIPQSVYEKDHALRLVFKKKSGSYAFCQDIKLYRYERPRKSGPGGGQSVATAPTGSRLSLEVMPNPMLNKAVISYSLPNPSVVSLRIFDITGRVVRNLCQSKYSSGQHLMVWDARDDVGRRLPSGVYFLNLETSGIKLSCKLLLLR